MFGFLKYKKMHNLPTLSFPELKKRTRIVVIDDDPNSFPIEILQKEGYAIEQWLDIQELSKLDDGFYDIIFLDIQGVGLAYSDQEGLGILEHIKQSNPGQIVVAFSGQSFDLSKTKFWSIADDALCKPVQAAKCKQVIDDLIKNKVNPIHYWTSIVELLRKEGVKERTIAKIEGKLYKAVSTNNKEEITSLFNSFLTKADMAVKLAGIAVKIASLIP